MRPGSIRLFQWLYPASLAATLLVVWLSRVQQQQPLAELSAQLGIGTEQLLFIIITIRSLLFLLLWWLVAWRRSIVAKWAVVVLFVVYLLAQIPTLLGGARIGPVTMTAMVLNAVAVWLLFRPDTEDWFWDDDAVPEEETPPPADPQ